MIVDQNPVEKIWCIEGFWGVDLTRHGHSSQIGKEGLNERALLG